MYWPFKRSKCGLREAGRRNAAVEHPKAQLCSAFLASGLTLCGNMKHGSCFHRTVWWKCLLTERKQHFYYKLWDRMGSESLGSIPPAQLPYNSLKDKSAWVCTLHGNGRWLAALNTHKPHRQWLYYYLFSWGKKTGIVMEFLWSVRDKGKVLARCFISLTKNNLTPVWQDILNGRGFAGRPL